MQKLNSSGQERLSREIKGRQEKAQLEV